jgi:hypothetical protein
MGNTTSSWGRPPQPYIMKVSWPIEGLPIATTKNLSILFGFYPFWHNSLFKTPILFSLRPDGGLRCSKLLCRPRTTLRRASPDGVPLGETIQGDQCEFARYTGADSQIATRHSQTVCLCSSTVRLPTRLARPPALRIEALALVSGTRRCVHVTVVKLSASTQGDKATHLLDSK